MGVGTSCRVRIHPCRPYGPDFSASIFRKLVTSISSIIEGLPRRFGAAAEGGCPVAGGGGSGRLSLGGSEVIVSWISYWTPAKIPIAIPASKARARWAPENRVCENTPRHETLVCGADPPLRGGQSHRFPQAGQVTWIVPETPDTPNFRPHCGQSSRMVSLIRSGQ
jgi:hypothetical protein